jgi:hypothetical protein
MTTEAEMKATQERFMREASRMLDQQERADFNRRMLALETAAREFMKAADGLHSVRGLENYGEGEAYAVAREDYGIAKGRLDAILTGKPAPTSPDNGALMKVTAALNSVISLLKAGGKKAAPSGTMFGIMIADYERALEAGRLALRAAPAEQGGNQ